MSHSQENVLKLKKPNEYTCIMFHYVINHSNLIIEVICKKPGKAESFYMIFGGVEYFEGSPVWGSANFSVASDDEFEELLNKMGVEDTELYLEYNRLFIVKQPTVNIKIIALPSFTKTKDLPIEFAWINTSSSSD